MNSARWRSNLKAGDAQVAPVDIFQKAVEGSSVGSNGSGMQAREAKRRLRLGFMHPVGFISTIPGTDPQGKKVPISAQKVGRASPYNLVEPS